jgi:hypothetical protein
MSKGLPTGLELIKDLKSFVFRFNQKSAVDCLYVSGALEHAEKELEAFEVIKKAMPIEKYDFFEENGEYYFLGTRVSKDAFNLLKEVLL